MSTACGTTGARALVVATAVVAVLALAVLPFAGRGALAVFVLTLPLAGLAAALAPWVRARVSGAVSLGLAATGCFVVFANVGFATRPLDPSTLAITALGLPVGLGVAWRAARSARLRGPAGHLLATAVVLLLDLFVWPRAVVAGHRLALLGICGGLGCGLDGLLDAARGLRPAVWRGLAAACVVACLAAGSTLASMPSAFDAAFDEPSLAAQVVRLARAVRDADGDGFSPWFAGGDCDDTDATAHPLSVRGRDCLGFVPGTPVPWPAPRARLDSRPAPLRIVLLSIDGLRCGLTDRTSPSFEGACPHLASLRARAVAAGLDRGDFRVAAPATTSSLRDLFSGALAVPAGGRPADGFLGDDLRDVGFRSAAVLSHPAIAGIPALAGSFDVADARLAAASAAPRATPDGRLVEALLDHLDALGADGRGHLGWVHLMGPHAPYVSREGASWVLPERANYRREVRRTDAAVARLLARLRASPWAGRTVLVVTADHGEAFAEHRSARHATTLYDEELRVPFFVVPLGDEAAAAARRAPLPRSTPAVRDYLRAVLGGPAVAPVGPQAARFFGQVAYVDAGLKLLYEPQAARLSLFDLRADPWETRNLARERPSVAAALGAAMGRALHLGTPPPPPAVDPDPWNPREKRSGDLP